MMGGRVVRGIGGRREAYQPIVSQLTESTVPLEVASALLDATGAAELYVADLDAISGRTGISPSVAELLTALPCPIWVDVGLGGGTDILDLPPLPRLCPVVGFETARTWGTLLAAQSAPGLGPVAFSIDLMQGELIGNWRGWGLEGPRDVTGLASRAVQLGARTLIVLDLARVGTGSGCGTGPLLRSIRGQHPEIELIAGGGARSWEDIDGLGVAGADAVLVASAIHNKALVWSTVPQRDRREPDRLD
jgi:phosphoribosylformimino-5-aminoimidazole carboxamide ribotide isomerase